MARAPLDEEALSDGLDGATRRAHGVYFTPAPLVEAVLERVAALVPGSGALAVIDPACGAGAFLAPARARFPGAQLFGLDLNREFLRTCGGRIPGAQLACADALDGGIEALRSKVPSDAIQLWVGNPPYNGTSLALTRPELFARLQRLLPPDLPLPPGTSLRDDFAFFLLAAARALEDRRGVLAFVTPSTLLDAFLYAPLRAALLRTLQLRHVLELGPGMFRTARVDTCVTIWTRGLGEGAAVVERRELPDERLPEAERAGAEQRRPRRSTGRERIAIPVASRGALALSGTSNGEADSATARGSDHALRAVDDGAAPSANAADHAGLSAPRLLASSSSAAPTRGALRFARPLQLSPAPPEFFLRAPDSRAQALHARWSELGEPLDVLVPVSLPGLKTRFDELLVDADPTKLEERLRAFLTAAPPQLETFAQALALPARTHAKLAALHSAALKAGVEFDAANLRPFWRYAGARHRAGVPVEARAYCYLDRRLIPRGDHRLRGRYDPHLGPAKLLFNVRERPLSATVLEAEGCVHDHRHTRFAPLLVPERVRAQGLAVTRSQGDLGPLVPNLSPRGLAFAEGHGGPLELFRRIARFVNSDPVQRAWVPAFGASRVLPVPLDPEVLR